MEYWDWFAKDERAPAVINYEAIAISRKKTIRLLKQDPYVLSRTIEVKYKESECDLSCTCRCRDRGEETFSTTTTTFWEMLVDHRTVTEKDLLKINGIDWHWLSSRVRLSRSTLARHKNVVDWSHISFWYTPIDAEFVRDFHQYIVWDKLAYVTDWGARAAMLNIAFPPGLGHPDPDVGVGMVECCLKCRWIAPDQLKALGGGGAAWVAPYSNVILKAYGAAFAESLPVSADLCEPSTFADMCIYEKHLPTSPAFSRLFQRAFPIPEGFRHRL